MSDTVDADNFEPFPVLKLDYRLDTDLSGDVRAGKTQHDRGAPRVLDDSRPCRASSPT